MAVMSMVLGGVAGSFAAILGWLVFGMSAGSAILLYMTFALALPCVVVATAMARGAVRTRSDKVLRGR